MVVEISKMLKESLRSQNKENVMNSCQFSDGRVVIFISRIGVREIVELIYTPSHSHVAVFWCSKQLIDKRVLFPDGLKDAIEYAVKLV